MNFCRHRRKRLAVPVHAAQHGGLEIPANCTEANSSPGYVACDLGHLLVMRDVPLRGVWTAFTVAKSPSHVIPEYTALAFSRSADPNFRNNSKQLIADGTVVRERDAAQVYVVHGGAQFPIPDPDVLHRLYGGWANVRVPNNGTLANYGSVPSGGTVLREDSFGEVYEIDAEGLRHWITSPDVLFRDYGGWAVVGVVPNGSISGLVEGPPRY